MMRKKLQAQPPIQLAERIPSRGDTIIKAIIKHITKKRMLIILKK
jgi:hypothetical protein